MPNFVFSATGAAKKHLVSEKPLIKRLFKNTGVVLAGIECSPKIFDFRANGIPVQESVDFFDTLTGCLLRQPVFYVLNQYLRSVCRAARLTVFYSVTAPPVKTHCEKNTYGEIRGKHYYAALEFHTAS